jgi:hypothetical protein
MNPKYPVYIISKGRWESRLTSRGLEAIGVPYRIVVEPQEFEQYSAVIDVSKILTLPFSNLGQGSVPARNWVWEHARAAGATRHWIMDDNIGRTLNNVGVSSFFRLNYNLKVPVMSGTPLRCMEDFVDRYENIALAGPNYFMFASRKSKNPPFVLNTRIYSCILIRNDLPYRWRGRYNEDTDLSLRALKDGWCTVLFNAFLCYKQTTMTMGGGNSDELYKGNGRLAMAESLVEQHPDVARVSTKWNRPQHYVDYSPFRGNRLIRKTTYQVSEGVDNYGMVLQDCVDGMWVTRPITIQPYAKGERA